MRDLHAAGTPISGCARETGIWTGGVAGSEGRFSVVNSARGNAAGDARGDNGGLSVRRRERNFVSRGTDLVGVARLFCRPVTWVLVAVGCGLSMVCGAPAVLQAELQVSREECVAQLICDFAG